MFFEVIIKPDENHWKGGQFPFTVSVSDEYPIKPPKVLCKKVEYYYLYIIENIPSKHRPRWKSMPKYPTRRLETSQFIETCIIWYVIPIPNTKSNRSFE